MDKPIVDEVIINPNPQGWFNRVYIHHLLDPRHPVIFSDDWDVQSPPKRVVFRFHYHSQKVIRSLGITWFGFLTPHDSRSRHLRDYVKILDMSWGPESVSRSGVSIGGVRILIVYLLYNENIPCHHGIVQFSNWNLFIDKSNYILCPQLNNRKVPLSTRHLFRFCHFFKQRFIEIHGVGNYIIHCLLNSTSLAATRHISKNDGHIGFLVRCNGGVVKKNHRDRGQSKHLTCC